MIVGTVFTLFLFLPLDFATAKWISEGCRKGSGNGNGNVHTKLNVTQDFAGEKLPTYIGLPPQEDAEEPTPLPLVLFFHGFGGHFTTYQLDWKGEPWRLYKDAYEEVLDVLNVNGKMITVGMTGLGGGIDDSKWPYPSWNGFGSTSSTDENPTCDTSEMYCHDCYCHHDSQDPLCNCYPDCNGACTDNCWWTTCKDSVQQTLELLRELLDTYCIDGSQIWAAGHSNGGMFAHELAKDERTAPYLAGIVTFAGLPHYGHNDGPYIMSDDVAEPISYLGMWGKNDTSVPPVAQSQDGCKTTDISVGVEKEGSYYTAADCVTKFWANQLFCSADDEPKPFEYETKFEGFNPITQQPFTMASCSEYTQSSCASATARNSGVPKVTGCIVETLTHEFLFRPAAPFIDKYIRDHPKVTEGLSQVPDGLVEDKTCSKKRVSKKSNKKHNVFV